MSNFSSISTKYEKDSIVQKTASGILFDLLDIQPSDDVLDLGCGTGHISKLIRDKTNGKVVGVDQSNGMIENAKTKYSKFDIVFHLSSAEGLNYKNEFDVIFCNSVFQWFKRPEIVLSYCFNALRNKGEMAIQAPAKDTYCPNFIKAIDKVKDNSETKEIFKSFTLPWLFLNTKEEYQQLFESVGFIVKKATINEVVTSHTVEEAYKIFESGAAAGYLNDEYYEEPITESYINSFKNIILESLKNEEDDEGNVDLTFYRIYLLAQKNVL